MTTTEVSTELVLTERHDGVLTITINRPAHKNAISRGVAVRDQENRATRMAGSPRLWCASRSLRRSKDGRSAGASKWHWPAT